jgi:hypothetical protein
MREYKPPITEILTVTPGVMDWIVAGLRAQLLRDVWITKMTVMMKLNSLENVILLPALTALFYQTTTRP